MKKIKRICHKCGKKVFVDPYEYGCPNCGEFFEDITNEGVLQHQENEKTEEIVSQLTVENKRRRNSANKEAFKAWAIGIPIGYLVVLVITFMSNLSEYGQTIFIALMACWASYIVVGPILIPIINKLRYDRKLQDEIVINDSSILEEKGIKGRSFFGNLSIFICICLLISSVIVFMNPILIFKFIHFGFVIGVSAFCFILVLVASLWNISANKTVYAQMNSKERIKAVTFKSGIAIFLVIVATVLTIIGMVNIPKKGVFEISNAQEFNILANMPYASECDYALTNDIDFNGSSTSGWSAIKDYKGTFDGQGYIIKNLKLNGEGMKINDALHGNGDYDDVSSAFGLVARNHGIIKNLRIMNSLFETDMNGQEACYCGSIAGINYGVIDNCSMLSSRVLMDGYAEHGFLGGLVGVNIGGIIKNCEFKGAFGEEGNEDIIIDFAGGNGSSYKVPYTYVGGLLGELRSGIVSDSYAISSIYNSAHGHWAYLRSGGICGSIDESKGQGKFIRVVAETRIKSECHQYGGSVAPTHNYGGFLGLLGGNVVIESCYSKETDCWVIGNDSGNSSVETFSGRFSLPIDFEGWKQDFQGELTPCKYKEN